MMLNVVILMVVLPALLKAVPSAEFVKDAVDRHNEYRALHGVDKVVENPAISSYAQEWADHLHSTGWMAHRIPNQYGENLAAAWPDRNNGAIYTDILYKEGAKFYLDHNYCGGQPDMVQLRHFGHYTQIVWKASTEIGVGKNGSFVVINYNPAGYYSSAYAENVPCLLKTPSVESAVYFCFASESEIYQ